MSDALSYSVELAAERSVQYKSLEKRLQKPGLYCNLLDYQLKKLGLKGFPSNTLVDSLASLKHDARSILDALIESGYKYYPNSTASDYRLSRVISLLDSADDLNKYIKTFRKLKEKLGYKTVNFDLEQVTQVENIFTISNLEGDVLKTIDILAESGYRLRGAGYNRKKIYCSDVGNIADLTKSDADGFLKAFRKLKEKFKYKSINNAPKHQIDYVLEISRIPGYARAIDHLALSGYKLFSKRLILCSDIDDIKRVSNNLWKEALEDFTPCLYEKSPVEFIEYFKGLGVEDKKVVIKSIFNCNKTFNDHEVITWLDKNYPELVREVGLSLV